MYRHPYCTVHRWTSRPPQLAHLQAEPAQKEQHQKEEAASCHETPLVPPPKAEVLQCLQTSVADDVSVLPLVDHEGTPWPLQEIDVACPPACTTGANYYATKTLNDACAQWY